MKNKEKTLELMNIAIEAVRHAQLCMVNLEHETRVVFLKWSYETYNALDLMEAWKKAMED